MPVQSIECTDTYVKICTAVGKCVQIDYSALSGTRLEQEEMLCSLLQELLDVRIRLNRLPQDDPDRSADPGQPDLFWDGQFLVSRSVLVVAAPWNEDHTRFEVQLAVARTYQPGDGG